MKQDGKPLIYPIRSLEMRPSEDTRRCDAVLFSGGRVGNPGSSRLFVYLSTGRLDLPLLYSVL